MPGRFLFRHPTWFPWIRIPGTCAVCFVSVHCGLDPFHFPRLIASIGLRLTLSFSSNLSLSCLSSSMHWSTSSCVGRIMPWGIPPFGQHRCVDTLFFRFAAGSRILHAVQYFDRIVCMVSSFIFASGCVHFLRGLFVLRPAAGLSSSVGFDRRSCSCRWPSIAFCGCVGCFFRHIFRQDDFVYVGLCCFDRLSSRLLFGRVSRFVSSFRVVCGSSFFLTCLASPSFFCAFLARTTSPCFRMSHSNCRISSAKLACGSMVLPLSRSSGWNWVWIVSWFPLSSGRGSSGSTNRWRVGWSRTEHPERCHPLSIPFERRNEKGKGEVGSSTFLGATPTPRFDSFPPGLVRSEPVEQPYATPLRVPRKGRWRRNHPNPHVPKETNTRLTSIAKHPTWHPRRKKPSKKRCPC